jgi:predicted amidohydrolase
MTTQLNIACIQWDIVWENKAANHEIVKKLVSLANIAPRSIIILPEMFDTGFSLQVDVTCDDHHHSMTFLSTLAKQTQCTIIAGITIKNKNNKGENQSITINPDGDLVCKYTKLHPFTLSREDQYFDAGTKTEVFKVHDFTFAPLICYDLRFPETFRNTVLQGADVYSVIANWPKKRADHFTTLLKARAIENQAYVIGVNRIGSDPNLDYAGGSQIISPIGEILASAGDQPEVIQATIRLESQRDYRKEFPVLKDIRKEDGNI